MVWISAMPNIAAKEKMERHSAAGAVVRTDRTAATRLAHVTNAIAENPADWTI